MFAKSSHKPYIFGTDEFLYTFGPEIFGSKKTTAQAFFRITRTRQAGARRATLRA